MGGERVPEGGCEVEGAVNRHRQALNFEHRVEGRPLVHVLLRLAQMDASCYGKQADFLVDTGAHRTILNTDLAAFVKAVKEMGGAPPNTQLYPIETLNGVVWCLETGPVDFVFSEGSHQEFTLRVDKVLLHPTFTGQSVIGMDALVQAQLTIAGMLDAGSPGYKTGSSGWLEKTVLD